MFDVICIDDSNRPNDIPTSQWIKKGVQYRVIAVHKMTRQPGIYGYELDGFDLRPYPPYQFFAHVRFAVIPPDVNKKEEAVKEIEAV